MPAQVRLHFPHKDLNKYETLRRSKMFKILEREQLTDNIFKMVVEAKRVAKSCLPGQFVIVRMDEEGVSFLKSSIPQTL